MSLRSRLARLSASGLLTPESSRAPAEGTGEAAREAPIPTPHEASAVPAGDLLADLRARMEALLARPPSDTAPPPPDDAELPFAVEQTDEGPLYVRTLRLSGAHRVGRVPVGPARMASSELLAVLALDPTLASRAPREALFLDTETTGLGAGAGTVAFLVGLAFWDEEAGLIVEQLLVRTPGDERPVLARVRDRLSRASVVVTFNGKSFDVPVLRARFTMNRMASPPEPPHLDLLHVARRLHKARGVGMRLGAIEREILGFVRENDVPSSEVSACYMHFLRTGLVAPLVGVVEHNAWDVVSMVALLGLYGEPLEGSELQPIDLVGVARTMRRAATALPRGTRGPDGRSAKEAMLDEAYATADLAHRREPDPRVLRARAELAKARGDRARALADFEALSSQVDDPGTRLELAKLYEHHVKDPARALELTEQGTGEAEVARARRSSRLEEKVRKSQAARAKADPKLW